MSKTNLFDRLVLTLIALFLGLIAVRPFLTPQTVKAQAENHDFYIEPGTTMLHSPDKEQHLAGRVVVDLTTGKIWGFPTITDALYPLDPTKTTPPVSYPIYLGRFDFSAIDTK